jgi:hypothetical protein
VQAKLSSPSRAARSASSARAQFNVLSARTDQILLPLAFTSIALPDRDYDFDERRLWARQIDAPQAIQSVSLHTRYLGRTRALVHINIWFKLTRLYATLSRFAPDEFPPHRQDQVPDEHDSVAVRLNMDVWMPFSPAPLDARFSKRKDLNFKIRPGPGREQRMELFESMLQQQLIPVLQRRWTEVELAALDWKHRDFPEYSDPHSRWQLLAYWHSGQLETCIDLMKSVPARSNDFGGKLASAWEWLRDRSP